MEDAKCMPSEEMDELIVYLRDVAFFRQNQADPKPRRVHLIYWVLVGCMVALAIGGGSVLVTWLSENGTTLALLGW